MNRRDFLKSGLVAGAGLAVLRPSPLSAAFAAVPSSSDWLRYIRIFRIDGYSYPLSERIEYDAEEAAKAFVEMRVTAVRIATIGKYAYMPGIRFTPHPDLGDRDLLAETIAACKPRGIRVIPYISTGNRLAVTLLTRDYPEYAQSEAPGKGPRVMEVSGEDRANVCWNTAYRPAFLDYIRQIVDNYEIGGLYFDAWMNAWYHYDRPHTCYCEGCREGFRQHSGREIPYHPELSDYSPEERATVRRYLEWKHGVMLEVFDELDRIAQGKNLPLITNANNPTRLALTDPRMAEAFDAYLYEGLSDPVSRAEAVSAAGSIRVPIWPSVGSSDGEVARLAFLNAAFGGGQIVTNQRLLQADADRSELAAGNRFLDDNQDLFEGFGNVPHAGVLFQNETRLLYATVSGAFHREEGEPTYLGHNLRGSTRGAYSALLERHRQVASLLHQVLEDDKLLSGYAVLFLPEVPYLTPEQIEVIRRYVRAGGGLVATFETSRFDASAARLAQHALHDLFGFEAETPSPRKAPYDRLWLRAPGLLSGEAGKRGFNLDADLYEVIRPNPGAEVWGEFVFENGETLPAIVASRYGEGRVVYAAFPLGDAWERGLGVDRSAGERGDVPLSLAWEQAAKSPLGELAAALADRAASRPAPYRVDASIPVIANLTANGRRCVLHLVRPGEVTSEPAETRLVLRGATGTPDLRPNVPHEVSSEGYGLVVTVPNLPAHLSILYQAVG